jgi:DNA (cytosine-5)-methyltransferase 1
MNDFSLVPTVDAQREINDRINSSRKRIATDTRNPRRTEQTVGTDPLLFGVLNFHFGFSIDLACTVENQLCPIGITEAEDSLAQDWHKLGPGFMWLNPPFNDCKTWARKCAEESEKGARIVMLTPASVGANWFRDFVYMRARIRFLNSRLKFVGHDKPFPKDCMISIYDGINFGLDIWEWRKGWAISI